MAWEMYKSNVSEKGYQHNVMSLQASGKSWQGDVHSLNTCVDDIGCLLKWESEVSCFLQLNITNLSKGRNNLNHKINPQL